MFSAVRVCINVKNRSRVNLGLVIFFCCFVRFFYPDITACGVPLDPTSCEIKCDIRKLESTLTLFAT